MRWWWKIVKPGSDPTGQTLCTREAGLFEGVKYPERDFLLGPEIGRIAEHVEQGLARFLVELLGIRQLLEHHDEARLGAGAMKPLRIAGALKVVEGVTTAEEVLKVTAALL